MEIKANYNKDYYKKNKETLNIYSNKWRRERRKELIVILGGKCANCGEDDQVVLDFDHINDDGAHDRKTNRRKNVIYDINIIDKNKYQLLCKNCNWRKEYYKRRYDAIKT